jgi:hypothetical protein
VSRGAAGEWFAVFFLLVVVYVLVRPGTQAPAFIDAFTKFTASLVRTVTDL